MSLLWWTQLDKKSCSWWTYVFVLFFFFSKSNNRPFKFHYKLIWTSATTTRVFKLSCVQDATCGLKWCLAFPKRRHRESNTHTHEGGYTNENGRMYIYTHTRCDIINTGFWHVMRFVFSLCLHQLFLFFRTQTVCFIFLKFHYKVWILKIQDYTFRFTDIKK